MANRIQKKNRTKKSPRNLAGAVLSLPALQYGDSRTFFIEKVEQEYSDLDSVNKKLQADFSREAHKSELSDE